MGNTLAGDAGTIGLMIDENLAVPGQPPKSAHNLVGELKTPQRVSRLIDTMTGSHDNSEIQAHKQLVCRLPAKGYGTTDSTWNQPASRR